MADDTPKAAKPTKTETLTEGEAASLAVAFEVRRRADGLLDDVALPIAKRLGVFPSRLGKFDAAAKTIEVLEP